MKSVFAVSALTFCLVLGFLTFKTNSHNETELSLSPAAVAASPDSEQHILKFASSDESKVTGVAFANESSDLEIVAEENLSVAGMVTDASIQKVACENVENFAWTIPSEDPNYMQDLQYDVSTKMKKEGYELQYMVADKDNPEFYTVWAATRDGKQVWLNWRVSTLEDGRAILLNACDFNELPPPMTS